MRYQNVLSCLILLLFSLVFFQCATNLNDEESIQSEYLNIDRFPSWFSIDIESDDKRFSIIERNPDSILQLIDDFTAQADSIGQLSPREKLYLQGFKLQVLTVMGRQDSTIALSPAFFQSLIELRDTAYLTSILANNNFISNYNYLTRQIEPFVDAALHFLSHKSHPKEQANIFFLKGILLLGYQRFEEAQVFFLQSYDYYSRVNDYKGMSLVNLNLGNLMSYIDSEDDSDLYYKKALKYAQLSGKSSLEFTALSNLGVFFKDNNQLDSAEVCFKSIINHELVKRSSDKSSTYLPALLNLSNIYFTRGNYELAQAGYDEVISVSKAKKLYQGLIYGTHNKGDVYYALGNYNQALKYYNTAIALCYEHNLTFLLIDLIESKERAYLKSGNIEKAYEISKELQILQDSFLNIEKQKVIREMELKYEANLKEVENKNLIDKLDARERELTVRNLLLIVISISLTIFVYLLHTKNKLNRGLNYAYKVLQSESREKSKSNNSATQIEKSEDAKVMMQIREFFEKSEPFLNPGIRVGDIAEKLKMNPREISLILKKNNFANFSSFVNEYRVERARQLFQNEEYKYLTVEAIGEMAGFGSKQSFYLVFETITGVKPGFYRSKFQ